jgi:hypothetical protein
MSEFSKPVIVKLNGRHVLTAEESDFQVKSNDQAVYTLAEGLAGFSDGAAEATISVQSPVPVEGVEVDWQGMALDHITADMSYNLAGKEYTVRGRVMDSGLASRVNQPNRNSMSFHGKVVGRPRPTT